MKYGYDYFLRRYQQIENDFLELTDFIEPDHDFRKSCYKFGSSKLMDFSLKIGTETETLFRIILESNRFDSVTDISQKRSRQNMDIYREIIEPIYNLSNYKLFAKHIQKEIYPFENFDRRNPDWFRIYSKFKHNKLELVKQWNLKFALLSLGGLLLLTINHPETDDKFFLVKKIDSNVFDLLNSMPKFCSGHITEPNIQSSQIVFNPDNSTPNTTNHNFNDYNSII